MRILVFGDTSTWNMENFSIDNINPKIIKKIQNADYVIYNLEGPIRKKIKKYDLQLRKNKQKDYLFKHLLKISGKEQPIVNSDESILKLFKLNKNTIVTLANNHIKDLGLTGFKDTINTLDENKIKYLGAGINNSEASKDLVIKDYAVINTNWVGSVKKGLKFKIYNALNEDYGSSYQNLNALKKKIRQYHDQNKKIILIIHGGKEMPKNNDDIGINLEKIRMLNSDITVIHHFHKYIKTRYEKDSIFCLGDFIFSRPGKLPVNRNSCFLEISEYTKLVKCDIQGG